MRPEMNDNKETNIFDHFGLYYDKMISWEKRLKKEQPFFEELIKVEELKRALDVGCGTGHHAIMFARLGLEVVAVDPSEEMIIEARKNADRHQVQVEFAELGMGSLKQLNRTFNLITCLGNSLAHMRTEESLRATMLEFFELLPEKGVLVLQMRNYDKVYHDRERFMPLNSFSDENQDIIFLRMTDLVSENQVEFNILTFQRNKGGEWKFKVLTEPLAAWRQPQLFEILMETGFANILTYGNYKGESWLREESTDLIMVAKK